MLNYNVLVNFNDTLLEGTLKIFRKKTHLNVSWVCKWLLSDLLLALSIFLINWIIFPSWANVGLPKILCHILSCDYLVARQLHSAWGQKGIEKVHQDILPLLLNSSEQQQGILYLASSRNYKSGASTCLHRKQCGLEHVWTLKKPSRILIVFPRGRDNFRFLTSLTWSLPFRLIMCICCHFVTNITLKEACKIFAWKYSCMI